MGKGIGPVETRFFTFGSESDPFVCESGEVLPEVTLAYEVYGEFNEAGDNAILLFHALTGGHHAAGENRDYTGADGPTRCIPGGGTTSSGRAAPSTRTSSQ